MFNKNEALWLPPGSVRALISLIVTLAVSVRLYAGTATLQDLGLLALVMTAYGIVRAGAAIADKINPYNVSRVAPPSPPENPFIT